MRDMNDDLIVTILVRTAVFISIWVPTTGFANRKGGAVEWLCTGKFNDHDQIMNPQISPEKLPQPYSPLFWLLWITNLFFMVSVKVTSRRNSLDGVDNTVTMGVQRPKDLESMLLNFTIMILLTINLLGFYLFWRK